MFVWRAHGGEAKKHRGILESVPHPTGVCEHLLSVTHWATGPVWESHSQQGRQGSRPPSFTVESTGGNNQIITQCQQHVHAVGEKEKRSE